MSITTAPARPQNILRGVTLIIAAAFTISVQDVVFKLFSNTLSLWQIFTVRALLALPLFAVLALAKGNRGALRGAVQKWPLLRGLCLTLTFMAFYAAIPFLSLSTVGAANYTAPIFITLLSAYVISEPVGRMGWIAVFVGFVGVVVLLKPGTDAFSPWALLPIIGAVFYALGHITTRVKCQSIPVTTMALSLNLMMLAAGLGASLLLLIWPPAPDLVNSYPNIFGAWSPITQAEWQVLVLLAGLAVLIGMVLAGAYQAAPPATVATFEYTYLIFVVMWDLTFFATMPKGSTLLGMIMIIGAGLMVLRRDARSG
ncbi:DMT family transporter [Roseovarius aestuarii]|uniref:EamA-like transporter family protein n=1 Tax=Roseovarius aestuarii TaxID=475083 RepID=A0A1X7BV63_9RHOB|nr:DMT family transporter [Roseovarius aestuarii]SMC13546.1 EamA-like transporter family protein [Roseovarius aestuarii]